MSTKSKTTSKNKTRKPSGRQPKRDRYGHFIGKKGKRPHAAKKPNRPARKPMRVLTHDPVEIVKPVEPVGVAHRPAVPTLADARPITVRDYAELLVRHQLLGRNVTNLKLAAFDKDGVAFRAKCESYRQHCAALDRKVSEALQSANRADERTGYWKALTFVLGAGLIVLSVARALGY